MSESIPRERSDPAPDDADGDDAGRGTLRARLGVGGGTTDPDAVAITCYVVTGDHGGITIPASFCRECHLFVRAADVAAERVDVPVDVRVVSWYTHVLGALRRGGYHPPVMVVGGTRLSQGDDVPSIDDVVAAIEDAAGR